MATPIISVIIPIYKVEKYLNQCIDSVVNQTYKYLEIILIDDGSPDNCPQICDQYAEKDERIFVIHKKNGGLSSARNAGISKASGDYIVFLDSDDYWDDMSAIEKLVLQIKDQPSDVICWGYKKLYENTKNIKEVNLNLGRNLLLNKSKEIAFNALIKNDCYIACAWNKLIRRELFEKNNLYFIEGIYSEDVDWCARLAIYSKSFDIFNNNFSIYRQRANSISKSLTEKNLEDLINNIKHCHSLLEDIANEKFKKAYFGYLANQLSNLIIVTGFFDKRTAEEYFFQIKPYKYVLKYGQSLRTKLIHNSLRFLGISCTLKILNFLIRLK